MPQRLLVGDVPYFGRFGFRPAADVRLSGPVDQRRVLWRGPGEPYSQIWEERFGEHAYVPLAEQAVTAASKDSGRAAFGLARYEA